MYIYIYIDQGASEKERKGDALTWCPPTTHTTKPQTQQHQNTLAAIASSPACEVAPV